MTDMRPWRLIALLIAIALGGCDRPPPEAYEKAQAASKGISIGDNATGEACTLVERGAGAADIYCGAWQQPSARVRSGGPASAGSLLALATSSPWRVELESRFACADPKAESPVLVVLQCARRSGGWPQVAIVRLDGGNAWLADGTPASYPVILRAVGRLSGGGSALAAADAPVSAAMASYLAAQAFSSGDIAEYEGLMTAGLQANLAGKPEAAEKAYRAALALQAKQKPAGDKPAGAAAMMSVALQLSDQGRFEEAKAFFDRAERVLLSPDAAILDINGQARLALYKGLNALNQDDPGTALTLFAQAEEGFRAKVPDARELPASASRHLPGSSGLFLGDVVQGSRPYETISEKEALLGVLESQRNRAVALRVSGDVAGAEAASLRAKNFAAANALTAPLYMARLHRTAGAALDARDQVPGAVEELSDAVRAFRASLPRTRPTAEAELLHASILVKEGRGDDALAECRAAAALLRDTKDAVDFERMQACLTVFATRAKAPTADRQALLAEMFAASQLARGTITDQEIRRTAVRLAAGGGDPKVSEAIRQQQDADRALANALRERDAVGQAPPDPVTTARIAELDRAIEAARAKLAEADTVVQSAAPNYQQLVQQPVRPDDVFAVLKPNEAFVSISLAASEGWTFVLRNKTIAVARIDRGAGQVAALVRRMRAGIEPGDNDRVPAFDFEAARQIYDLTLGGVAPALEGVAAVTVAPTGALLSVPFGALLTGPSDPGDLAGAPFLVRRFVITHVPAAANFVKLRQTAASAARHDWFGFGDFRPVTQAQADKTYAGEPCRPSAEALAHLPRLDGTQKELALAGRIFGAGPGDVRTGTAFTVDAVKALALKDYRIVHFAAHALLPAELACQDEPAIVTSVPNGAPDARGALLTASEVAGLKLDADAVILSACNSGGPGGTTAGESLAGLARSFFYAGARSLVVTHWTVDDSVATIIVANTLNILHRDRAQGLASALRQAQLAYLARTDFPPVFKHPYYWAPFALVGEGSGQAPAAEIAASSQRGARL